MTNRYTKKEIENFGYSKADAARLANDSNFNWKAFDGGKRTAKGGKNKANNK